MERMKKFGRALFIALCLCYIFNLGGVQGKLVLACDGSEEEGGNPDACVTREGPNYICDCVGNNCGKNCSRQISSNCPGGTCKAPGELD